MVWDLDPYMGPTRSSMRLMIRQQPSPAQYLDAGDNGAWTRLYPSLEGMQCTRPVEER